MDYVLTKDCRRTCAFWFCKATMALRDKGTDGRILSYINKRMRVLAVQEISKVLTVRGRMTLAIVRSRLTVTLWVATTTMN